MPVDFDDCNGFYHYLLNQNRYLEKNKPTQYEKLDIKHTIESNGEMVVSCTLGNLTVAKEFKKLKDYLQ